MPKRLKAIMRSRVSLCLVTAAILTLALAVVATAQEVEYLTLFADDFESGQAQDWTPRGVLTGEWSVQEKDSNHFLDVKGHTSLNFSTGPGSTWTDYVFRVRLVLLEGEAGINFRLQTSPTGSGPIASYLLQLSRYDLRLNKVTYISGSPRPYELLASSPVDLRPGPWYTVSVDASGNQLAISVDGVPELKYVDVKDPLLNGSVNLTAYSGGHALFDDVWVGRVRAPGPTPATMQQPQTPVLPGAATAAPAWTPPPSVLTQPTPTPQPPAGSRLGVRLPWDTLAAIVGVVTGVGGAVVWLIHGRAASSQKRHLKRLLDEIDTVYTRFKMNTRRCEAELYRLKDVVVEGLKEGKVTEESYGILDKRVDSYLKEVQEKIIDEKLGGFPSMLKNSLHRMLREGAISQEEFDSVEKLLMATADLSEAEKSELRDSLARWRSSYLKADTTDKSEGQQ
ncbi:MAG: hypothetical protein HY672_03915 [Chloroflexi bacterium]|nr:hypothetical protein [Chloroflexota bacterium]